MNPRPAPSLVIALVGLALMRPVGLQAQVSVDRPVVLEGASAADRQVIGIAPPAQAHDAMNAATMQRGSYRTDVVSGATWAIILSPAPANLAPGTELTVLSLDSNPGPVQATVNGSGPYAVLKDGSKPLAPGDVPSGAMLELVFDGAALQLISGLDHAPRACAAGFVAVNERYCIEQVQNDTMRFDLAASHCAAINARLCSWGEWYTACAKAGTLGITDHIGDWEWNNDSGNADGSARMSGFSVCHQASVKPAFNPPGLPFRCCMRR